MNILFVLYGDLSCNSAYPLVLYARELSTNGHACAVAIPDNLDTVSIHGSLGFKAVLYQDALADPSQLFADGRPADVIHAWTPREIVRTFVYGYMALIPTPLVIYLEDNEAWITQNAVGMSELMLWMHSERELAPLMPVRLSHPQRYPEFIGLADAAVVIQEKLSTEVPIWVECHTVMPGMDLQFFSPREKNPAWLSRLGLDPSRKLIVYSGGINDFTRPGIRALCQAVVALNEQGLSCTLVRTGPVSMDFIEQEFSADARLNIIDLGVVPRAELPSIMSLADVFVQPGGINPFEDLRLPGKLPEFMAMGIPVVMPDVNIASLLEDGNDVLLLKAGTSEEIAHACGLLFRDADKRAALGASARKFAEVEFDVHRQAVKLACVYESAISRFMANQGEACWVGVQPDTPARHLLLQKLRNAVAPFPPESAPQDLHGVLSRLYSGLDARAKRIDDISVHVNEYNSKLTVAIAELARVNGELHGVYVSYSWRLTKPLRILARWILKARKFLVKGR